MKLSVIYIPVLVILLSCSANSEEESLKNSVVSNMRTGVGKIFHIVGDSMSSSYKKLTLVLGARGVPKPKKKSKPATTRKAKGPTKRPHQSVDKGAFERTDDLLSSQWYNGHRNNETHLTPKPKVKSTKLTTVAKSTNSKKSTTALFQIRNHTPYPIYFSDGSNAEKEPKQVKQVKQVKPVKQLPVLKLSKQSAEKKVKLFSESLSVEGLDKSNSKETHSSTGSVGFPESMAPVAPIPTPGTMEQPKTGSKFEFTSLSDSFGSREDSLFDGNRFSSENKPSLIEYPANIRKIGDKRDLKGVSEGEPQPTKNVSQSVGHAITYGFTGISRALGVSEEVPDRLNFKLGKSKSLLDQGVLNDTLKEPLPIQYTEKLKTILNEQNSVVLPFEHRQNIDKVEKTRLENIKIVEQPFEHEDEEVLAPTQIELAKSTEAAETVEPIEPLVKLIEAELNISVTDATKLTSYSTDATKISSTDATKTSSTDASLSSSAKPILGVTNVATSTEDPISVFSGSSNSKTQTGKIIRTPDHNLPPVNDYAYDLIQYAVMGQVKPVTEEGSVSSFKLRGPPPIPVPRVRTVILDTETTDLLTNASKSKIVGVRKVKRDRTRSKEDHNQKNVGAT
ncbi:unnamed protein product [Phyllotreta striolata]|uniref:Uncharacterized protein n=1 Tax=Phyllotreta striolata TaxID=444603 RepID=A0A9N9XK16_PHYSR|nr:unnamed protein product [Phyllotreta striolata]